MADSRLKQIRIKTGVVKRLGKEKVSYVKEVEQEKAKLAKMQGEGGDSYVLRKQEEVIRESAMMITDCSKRLQSAYSELMEMLDNEADLAETEEYQAAAAVIKDLGEAVADN